MSFKVPSLKKNKERGWKSGRDGVDFINILRAHFYMKVFWAAFLCLEFGFEQTFVQKMRA